MIHHDLLRWAFLQVLVLVAFASAFAAVYGGVEADPLVHGSEAAELAFGSMGRAMKTLAELSVDAGEPYPERTWVRDSLPAQCNALGCANLRLGCNQLRVNTPLLVDRFWWPETGWAGR